MTALYLICLLDLLTHVQLNLLGRHNYVSSVYEQATPEEESFGNGYEHMNGSEAIAKDGSSTSANKLDPVSERQYLSFGWWFLQKGWRQVSDLIAQVVEEALGP